MSATTMTDLTFDQTIAHGRVLVDFWAEWCGPCKAMAPILDEIAAEYPDKLLVAKLDVDANPAAAARFGIRSIPTMILFDDGREVERFVGARSKVALVAELAPVLA